MGEEIPKQLIELRGKPLIIHTVGKFLEFSWNRLLISVPELWKDQTREIIKSYYPNAPIEFVIGGDTRSRSIFNCLSVLEDEDLRGVVSIHDGVRPMVGKSQIANSLKEAGKYGSAIPVVNPVDTVRTGEMDDSSLLDRDRVYLVQTPQSFVLGKIIQAYKKGDIQGFTDDAGVYEKEFGEVHLIEGEEKNIKITKPSDLVLAEFLLGS